MGYDPVLESNLLKENVIEEPYDHEYIPAPTQLTQFVRDVLDYIGGYVVKSAEKCIPCRICKQSLHGNQEESSDLVRRKNRGRLHNPSFSVRKICQAGEQCLREMLVTEKKLVPSSQLDIIELQGRILRKLDASSLFPSLNAHFLESPPDNGHLYQLVKSVVSSFLKVRLHHVAKERNATLSGKKVRHMYTKLVLFKHQ